MNISRLKFDIDELVDEILDHIPEEVFSSDSTTFLDPEMGGGQFVKEVEKRLRSYGHSDENISSRVTGFASSKIQLNYVVRKHKLVGQYSIFNIMENSPSKKFDVVIGNPPFQDTKSKNKKGNSGKKNLYQKFIELSSIITKDDGVFSLISPPGFLKSTQYGKPNKYFNIINSLDIIVLKLKEVEDHFVGVWNPMCYFVVKKSKPSGNTKIYSDEEFIEDIRDYFFIPRNLNSKTMSIFEKIFNKNGDKLNIFRNDPNNYINVDRDKKYVSFKRMNNRMTTLKALPGFDNGELKIECRNIESMLSILNSSVFSYINRRTYYDAIVYHGLLNGCTIPDQEKIWSDKELFDFYGFSKEERDEIVNNSKSLLKGKNR